MLPLSFGRNFVLEDHAEDLPAQPLGQPRVLDDGQFEAFAVQHGVVVGVDGTAHAFNDHKVRATLAHHRGQDFVQSTGGAENIKNMLLNTTAAGLIGFWYNNHQITAFKEVSVYIH